MVNLRRQQFMTVCKRIGLGVVAALGTQLLANLMPMFIGGASANPTTLTLTVYPLDGKGQFPICPTELRITESLRPYYEGGYTRDGAADLSWVARAFKVESKDEFSVIWSAQLQPKYRNCRGSASMTQLNGESYMGLSYLRMRFVNGTAYLILDMTGNRDINGLTTVITKHGIKNGQPFWSWSGTD